MTVIRLETAITPDNVARRQITQRLCDVITWPASRITLQERQLAGDLLVGLLRVCPQDVRQRCAVRLAGIVDAPKGVLRYLACDELSVASPLLAESKSFDDVDLVDIIRVVTPAHLQVIAQRRPVAEFVSEALVRRGDPLAVEHLLRNTFARLAQTTVNAILRLSRDHPELIPLLLKRDELRPQQGLTLFWWANHTERSGILRRFAIDRTTLIAEMQDYFALSTTNSIADPEIRKALQFLERRQRSRRAAEVSSYGSVEGVIEAMTAQGGPSRELTIEFAHLCGLRPAAVARIFTDRGGEPLAVLAKAIGLKSAPFQTLCRMLRLHDDAAHFEQIMIVYQSLAPTKAQTVLRYWNWGMTADMGEETPDADVELAPARRFFSLVQRQEL